MGKEELLSEVLRLGPEDRFEMLRAISESLSESTDPDMTPELAAELQRRMALDAQDPSRGSPWPDVRARIEASLRKPHPGVHGGNRIVNLIVDPEAEEESNAAAAYYQAQREGLAFDFLDEVGRVLEMIAQRPLMYPQAPQSPLRKAPIDRFPYVIYYHVRDDLVRVVAIVHGARHPRTWRQRH